jgi:hypothetical protein
MRTDADDPTRIRDPAIELLLSHTATLTDEGSRFPPCRARVVPAIAASSGKRFDPHVVDDGVRALD